MKDTKPTSRSKRQIHYLQCLESDEFHYAEGVVHYSKIHVSVDWINKNNAIYKDCLRF